MIIQGKQKMSLIWDYFSYMFFYSLLGGVGYALIKYIKYSKVGKKAGSVHFLEVMKKELPKLLLTAYCVGIIAVTVFQYIMIREMGFDPAAKAFRFSVYWKNVFSASRVNLIPFKTIGAYFSFLNASGRNDTIRSISLVNLLGNILVFCPLGVLLPIVFPRFNNVWKILAAGAVFSFLIEFVQFFVGRSSDIDDIFFNTLGVVLGFGGYSVFRFFFWRKKSNKKGSDMENTVC